ncbi:MAG: GNAT family N-acetyltransferase [Eubacteriales bacterium]|nr:GNAT family N-acetyltransferase [Eubacteriales bacterium]
MEYLKSYFHVRSATYDDIEAIQSIVREAFLRYAELSEVAEPEALRESARDIKKDIDNMIVLIAERDNTPVGSVRVKIDEETKTAYLSRFAVKVSSQNNGIGKSLMNLVDEIMIKHGVKRISLHTDSKIASLMRFYYGRGFYVDSTDKSRGYVRAYMVKEYK